MIPETLLFRQANPKFIEGDLITSQVFMPFPKDGGFLSAYDGNQITSVASHIHFTTVLGYESHSVWAVSKEETDSQQVPAEPDPLPQFQFHSKIDFTKKPEKEWRKIAKRLKAFALSRGCQFKPAVVL